MRYFRPAAMTELVLVPSAWADKGPAGHVKRLRDSMDAPVPAALISPITFVTPDDPPTLIIHGDEDPLVPLQQSELIVDKFKKTGVEAKLVVKKGAGHGWAGLEKDLIQFADWFDEHLKKANKASPSATR